MVNRTRGIGRSLHLGNSTAPAWAGQFELGNGEVRTRERGSSNSGMGKFELGESVAANPFPEALRAANSAARFARRTCWHAAPMAEHAAPMAEKAAETVAGMQSHNRHLAAVWRLGPPGGEAAPLCKLSVDSVYADACRSALSRQWVDGVLKLYDGSDSQRAKLKIEGFSTFTVTKTPHNADRQRESTLKILSGHLKLLRLYLNGFPMIESCVLEHAKTWCATLVAPHEIAPLGMSALSRHHSITAVDSPVTGSKRLVLLGASLSSKGPAMKVQPISIGIRIGLPEGRTLAESFSHTR